MFGTATMATSGFVSAPAFGGGVAAPMTTMSSVAAPVSYGGGAYGGGAYRGGYGGFNGGSMSNLSNVGTMSNYAVSQAPAVQYAAAPAYGGFGTTQYAAAPKQYASAPVQYAAPTMTYSSAAPTVEIFAEPTVIVSAAPSFATAPTTFMQQPMGGSLQFAAAAPTTFLSQPMGGSVQFAAPMAAPVMQQPMGGSLQFAAAAPTTFLSQPMGGSVQFAAPMAAPVMQQQYPVQAAPTTIVSQPMGGSLSFPVSAAPMVSLQQPMVQPMVAQPMMTQPMMTQPLGGSVQMQVVPQPMMTQPMGGSMSFQVMPQPMMTQPLGGSVQMQVMPQAQVQVMPQPIMTQPLGGSVRMQVAPQSMVQMQPMGGSFSMPVAVPQQTACGACNNPGCSNPGTQMCSQCGMAAYCSQDCQKSNWPAHKTLCKQLASSTSLSQQRAPVAAPMTMMQTQPMTMGMMAPMGGSFSMPVATPMPNAAGVCGNPGCFKQGVYGCSKCGQQTYCSQECQKADWPKHKAVCKETATIAPLAPQMMTGFPAIAPMGGSMQFAAVGQQFAPMGGSFSQFAPMGGSFSMPVAMPQSTGAGPCGNTGCLKPATNLCGGCGLKAYCSQECQKKAWPTHKKECKK